MTYHIGTCGWHYPQWQPAFYNSGLAKEKWLPYYASQLGTVEINNSFYRLPSEKTLLQWHAQTPSNFIFSAKAWRQITHERRMKRADDDIAFFFARMSALKHKLGPVIFQLPPSMGKDVERLRSVLSAVPPEGKCVIEFRNASWYSDDVYQLLSDHNVALCAAVEDVLPATQPKTSNFLYMRLHGPKGNYRGSYDDAFLKQCAEWIKKQSAGNAFIYFNNTIGAPEAIDNACTLQNMLLDHSNCNNPLNKTRPLSA